MGYTFASLYYPALIPFFVAMLGIYFLYFALVISLGCCSRKPDGWRLTMIVSLLGVLFGHNLQEEKRTDGQVSKFTVYGRQLNPFGLTVQAFVVVTVLVCSSAAFWSEFILGKSNQCDSSMHCFAFNVSVSRYHPVQQAPLENCISYEEANHTIRCYSVSLNYAGALGSAGGVLILAKVATIIRICLWVGINSSFITNAEKRVIGLPINEEGKEREGRRKNHPDPSENRNTCCNISTFIFLVCLDVLIPLVAPIPLLFQFHGQLLGAGVFEVFNLLVYWFTLCVVFTASGPCFILITDPPEAAKERHSAKKTDLKRSWPLGYGSTDSRN